MSCRSCDRSSSSIDVRHAFTLNAVYQLPFGPGKRMLNTGVASQVLGGWELAGITSARTGLPVNITMTRKASQMLDGNTSNQRPNLVPGMSIYAPDQTISNWFNPAAFSTPAKYTWGNLGRYAATGPGNFEVDLALQKRFRLTERFSLNVRASAFNLANHPQYATPASNWSKSSFGEITDVLNYRGCGHGRPAADRVYDQSGFLRWKPLAHSSGRRVCCSRRPLRSLPFAAPRRYSRSNENHLDLERRSGALTGGYVADGTRGGVAAGSGSQVRRRPGVRGPGGDRAGDGCNG